jgi:copper chaperone/Cu+-exporting ATPase
MNTPQANTTINIEGMHCGACVRRVTAALQAVPGALIRNVDIGKAEIAISDSNTLQAAQAAIERIGFTVTGIR